MSRLMGEPCESCAYPVVFLATTFPDGKRISGFFEVVKNNYDTPVIYIRHSEVVCRQRKDGFIGAHCDKTQKSPATGE